MSIFAPSIRTEDPEQATAESIRNATRRIFPRTEVTEDVRRERAASIALRFGQSQGEVATRDYKGASVNLANYNWLGSDRSADAEQANAMPVMRARARDLEQNNAYAERYLAELEANVLGPEGMNLQMQIQEWDANLEGEPDPATGRRKKGGWIADEAANDIIESAWYEWRKSGVCDTSMELSFHEIERLMLRSTARDGHILCRMVRNWGDNDFRFALQIIESDALDTSYNTTLPNGNIVIMGVEMNAWRQRIAYHILTRHPGDYFTPSNAKIGHRERVPAEDMIHLRFLRRAGQTIGVTWFAPVMDLMEMLRGYEEAEVISARAESCKGGHYVNKMSPEGFAGVVTSPDGIRKRMAPGQMEILPHGWEFQPYNPTHPNGNYQGFRQGVLRGIASGLSCSYNILANDLVGVSYSSLRGGLLDERELYKMLQGWIASRFHMRVFEAWLDSSMVAGAIKLPIRKFDKFNAPFFQGRRWSWVDPLKDIQAHALAIKNGFETTRGVVSENGNYILDIAKDQKADKDLQARYGLRWGDDTEAALIPTDTDPADDPEAALEAAATAQDASVADTALNGIQVQALLDILAKVGTGELTKATAKAVIHASFPLMDEDTINTMLADIQEGSLRPTQSGSQNPATGDNQNDE